MALVQKKAEKKITIEKAKLTQVGRAFKSVAGAAKAVDRVEKIMSRFSTPDREDQAEALASARNGLVQASEAVECLRRTLAQLDGTGYITAKKGTAARIELAPEVRVWIKEKRIEEYAEAYTREQLGDLYVDRITTNGKILVRIGAKPSVRYVGFVPANHMTTRQPKA